MGVHRFDGLSRISDGFHRFSWAFEGFASFCESLRVFVHLLRVFSRAWPVYLSWAASSSPRRRRRCRPRARSRRTASLHAASSRRRRLRGEDTGCLQHTLTALKPRHDSNVTRTQLSNHGTILMVVPGHGLHRDYWNANPLGLPRFYVKWRPIFKIFNFPHLIGRDNYYGAVWKPLRLNMFSWQLKIQNDREIAQSLRLMIELRL